MLSKQAILEVKDLPIELVNVPEWGGEVYVRTLTGTERDAYEAGIIGQDRKPDLRNIRAKLLVRCLVDAEGRRLFSEADVDLLGNKSASVLDRLFAVAQRLSKLTAADIEDLEKN